MKKFMAVYIGKPAAFEAFQKKFPSEEARKAQEKKGIEAWHQWNKTNAGAIVDIGAPLGKTKSVSASGISDTRNALTGYTIVKAESYEAAAKLFLNHPHFNLFPGDSVEIMECLPIPGM